MIFFTKKFNCIVYVFLMITQFNKGLCIIDKAILKYRAALPSMSTTSESTDAGDVITHFLTQFCPPCMVLENTEVLSTKINHLIKNKKELKLYLPGFPFKSINRAKCISSSPDLGEFLALTTLEHMAATIATIYPAISITIVSDGYPYKTIVDPDDDEIALYHAQLRKLVANFPHLIFEDGLSIGSRGYSLEGLRMAVTEEVLPAWTEENQETLKDMQTFIKHDCAFLGLAADKILDISTTIMQSSMQYAQFLRKHFPESEYLRLSVHPHTDVSKKLGLNLIYGCKGTPWHNAVVITNNKISLTNHIILIDMDDPKPEMFDIKYWHGLAFLQPATLVLARGGYIWVPDWN